VKRVKMPRPYHPARWLIGVIRGYQRLVSPALSAHCRYRPTCSEYAATALDRHGLIRGGWMAFKRVGRCHPFRDGGYDPVPNVDATSPRSAA
jgi:putative membrane protein insertion efficiency factor